MKNFKYILTALVLSAFCLNDVVAQAEVPSPAPKQTETISITGATIHVGTGEVIENGTIVFDNGKIISVGPGGSSSGKVINAQGMHVYPGLISCGSTLGLSEIGAVRATRDFSEVGSFTPNIRSVIAYNTDSKVIPTIRTNGILLSQITPQGGVIPGSSTVVHLDAWNWQDAVYKLDNGMHVNWPPMFEQTGWWAEPGPIKEREDYEEKKGKIKQFFDEARAYGNGSRNPANLKFEAMAGVFSKQKKLYVRVGNAKGIIDAILFFEEYNIDLVIMGGAESYLVTDVLKERNIPVVLNGVHNLPYYKDDDIDQPFRVPAILQEAGIVFAISTLESWDGYWNQRNLPFHAGTAVAYGLDKEAALQSLSLNPAKILGIDNITGSLEVGKDANIIISSGDLLDMRSNDVTHAFIQGRAVNLNNKQKHLAEKFREKYKAQGLID